MVSVSKQRSSRLRGAGESAAFECAQPVRPVGHGVATQRLQILRRCDPGEGASRHDQWDRIGESFMVQEGTGRIRGEIMEVRGEPGPDPTKGGWFLDRRFGPVEMTRTVAPRAEVGIEGIADEQQKPRSGIQPAQVGHMPGIESNFLQPPAHAAGSTCRFSEHSIEEAAVRLSQVVDRRRSVRKPGIVRPCIRLGGCEMIRLGPVRAEGTPLIAEGLDDPGPIVWFPPDHDSGIVHEHPLQERGA